MREQEKQIVYIDVEKLHPHEQNPRKNIGDVTELADSIKVRGIMQNLTVVPTHEYGENEYKVIIGHRRLAAAKQIGMKHLPCVITEMTQNEQLATMMLENIQRSDLTVYEQAQGMQMMLDLGETVKSISEKTGFSQSTIRRRVRLSKLDSGTFKELECRQISLNEYDKLFEIKDDNTRNELLKEMGTNNFEWNFKRALNKEKSAERLQNIINRIKPYSKEIKDEDTSDLKFIATIFSEEDIPDEIKSGEYFYQITNYSNYIYLYGQYTDEEKAEIEEKKKLENIERLKTEERRNRLKELFKQACEMRFDFIKNFSNYKGNESAICKLVGQGIFATDKNWSSKIDINIFNELMNTQIESDFDYNQIVNMVSWNMKSLLALAYSILDDKKNNNNCYDFSLKFNENKDLIMLYDILCELGYKMSEEEQSLINGTHELYTKKEN